MSAKKNPLYVVSNKGKDVEPAENLFDLVVKKFHLAPVVDFIQLIFRQLLNMVKDYPTFVAVKEIIDSIIARVQVLATRFA